MRIVSLAFIFRLLVVSFFPFCRVVLLSGWAGSARFGHTLVKRNSVFYVAYAYTHQMTCVLWVENKSWALIDFVL